jgi:hypothetical protein
MGKHETGYARVERDLYPTPSWVIAALAEHVEFAGVRVWEPACGDGRMAAALRSAGCAGVYMSDIADTGPQHEVFDFTSEWRNPELERFFDAIITNPPYGKRNRLAEAFIAVGLRRLDPGGLLALLLPADFDSAKTRARYFGDCPHFIGKITLTKRIVWFERNDGEREAPKENHAWFLWQRSLLRTHRPPIILYAPERADEALRQLEQLRRHA